MTQYKPHVIEEDSRSAWEKRISGIQGTWAEEAEGDAWDRADGEAVYSAEQAWAKLHASRANAELSAAPNPTVAHGGASGKPYQELIDVNVGKVSGKRKR